METKRTSQQAFTLVKKLAEAVGLPEYHAHDLDIDRLTIAEYRLDKFVLILRTNGTNLAFCQDNLPTLTYYKEALRQDFAINSYTPEDVIIFTVFENGTLRLVSPFVAIAWARANLPTWAEIDARSTESVKPTSAPQDLRQVETIKDQAAMNQANAAQALAAGLDPDDDEGGSAVALNKLKVDLSRQYSAYRAESGAGPDYCSTLQPKSKRPTGPLAAMSRLATFDFEALPGV